MLSPCTVTFFAASGAGAGPPLTEPSAAENRLPWHGQLITPLETLLTVQPACVQMALKHLKVPFAGWVTTTFSASMIFPPPTGMSVVFASTLPPVLPAAPVGAWLFGPAVGVA